MNIRVGNIAEMFEKGRMASQEDRKRSTLSRYLQPALSGDAAAKAQVYGADPEMGMRLDSHLATQAKTQQEAAAAARKEAIEIARAYAQNPNPMLAQMLTPHIRKLGPQFAEMPDNAWEMPGGQEGFAQAAQALASLGEQPDMPSSYQEHLLAQKDPKYAEFLGSRQPWQAIPVTEPGGTRTVWANPRTRQMQTLDGQPYGAQPSMPAPTTGGGGQVLYDAVEQVESGGNPNAVSPKGALGPMQTMPGTLADPGFGVAPARDRTPDEMRRVGRDYLDAMMQRYGDPRLALAAYNWGPGNVDAALKRHGNNVDAVLANAPAETRAYVPNVIARAQGGSQRAPARPPVGGIGFKPDAPRPRMLTDAEVAAEGLPKGTKAYRDSDGIVKTTYTPPASAAQGKALPGNIVTNLTKQAEIADTLTGLVGGFKDDYAGNRLGGSVENMMGRLGVPGATPGQADWWQAYDRQKNVIRNELFGAALSATEQAAFEAADINPNMAPARIRENLRTQHGIISRALTRQAKVWSAQGYNADAIREATTLATPPQQPNKPVRIRNAAEYHALPSGAVYITPDGQTKRKK